MKPQSFVLIFITANSVQGSGEIPAFASHSMTFKYDVRSQSERKVKYIENHVIYKSQLKRKSVFGLIPKAKINGNSVESDVDEKLPFFAMDDDVNSRQKSSYVTSDNNYHFDLEQAQNNPVFQVFNQVMSPIFGREIQKGVDKTDIKGAWIFTAFTFLLAGFDPMMSVIAATTMAYVAITPGVGGDVVRATGKASWTLLNSIRKLVSKICSTRSEYKTKNIKSSSPPVNQLKKEIPPDDTVAKFVEDVESTLKEVEDKLQKANSVNVDADILARQQDEARTAELEYLLEEAKIDKEARIAEKEFQLEQEKIEEELRLAERFAEEERLARIAEEERLARIAEEERLARIAEEERLARIAEEERLARIAEEERIARIAEEERLARIAEEEKITEEERLARIAEEEKIARITEDERIAEEARLAAEDDDDNFIDPEEWEAMIQIAEDLDSEDAEEPEDWGSARKLAKDLALESEQQVQDIPDYNNPNLSDEERMELIGKAARAAVEKFESERNLESDNDTFIKETVKKAGIGGLSSKSESPIQNENDTTSTVDYSKMTVVQLKDILRSKGLKVSGRKAELIERLQSS